MPRAARQIINRRPLTPDRSGMTQRELVLLSLLHCPGPRPPKR